VSVPVDVLVRVRAPHFCAGLVVLLSTGVVTNETAPILAWARGKPWSEVRAYLDRRGWMYEAC
jgi:hypothetical protein